MSYSCSNNDLGESECFLQVPLPQTTLYKLAARRSLSHLILILLVIFQQEEKEVNKAFVSLSIKSRFSVTEKVLETYLLCLIPHL